MLSGRSPAEHSTAQPGISACVQLYLAQYARLSISKLPRYTALAGVLRRMVAPRPCVTARVQMGQRGQLNAQCSMPRPCVSFNVRVIVNVGTRHAQVGLV